MRYRSFQCIACLSVLLVLGCQQSNNAPSPTQTEPAAQATFVGGGMCAGCHVDEAALWTGSHHDRAMQAAGMETVLGDFDNAEFVYNDVTSTFFRRGGDYWVSTDGPQGELADFRVTHTFGIDPLQQYLVQLPDGRHQSLSIAWDTRPVEQGGQRWLHLYVDEQIDYTDPLHWTGTYQSWNTMCAECHSTNVVKNFDLGQDNFDTAWSSINVDCEACHGPGSIHVEMPSEGLGLATAVRAWVFAEDMSIAQRVPELASTEEIEVCAQCHSRRAQFTDEYEPGEAFLDGFRPALLDSGLYHADGQILDEVYVYGSFLQSKMHDAGVTCSDCHDPHSGQLRAEGNAVCAQCHRSSTFDGPQHHNHAAGSTGAACVDCHMRAQTYMVVDPRRDHSFRVPRPDLSVELGMPNACNDCHGDQTAAWAAEQVESWYPDGRSGDFHYAEALHAGRNWSADRGPLLRRVIDDPKMPAIVRASALNLLAYQPDDAALDSIESALRSDEELLQLAALDALDAVPLALRIDVAQRFLTHPKRALRIAAARSLVPARGRLSDVRRADLDAALQENASAQRFNGDRGDGLLNLANLQAQLGQTEQAEATLRLAFERHPEFTASYVNLADLYRRLGREIEAEALLRAGLTINPDAVAITHALGLSLVRSNQLDEALVMLRRASELSLDAPHYQYVLGVALNSTGEGDDALIVLSEAHERFPGHSPTLVALATMSRDAGDIDAAVSYARELLELSPSDATARALLAELGAAP